MNANMKSDNSWLVRTGQAWKVKAAIVIGLIALILLLLMIWSINSPNNLAFKHTGIEPIQINSVFLLFGLILIYLLFWSIKCPSCRKNVGYHVVKTNGINSWYRVLLSLDKCPICNYAGDT